MLSLIPLALLASLALLALYFGAPRQMELKPIRVRARRQP